MYCRDLSLDLYYFLYILMILYVNDTSNFKTVLYVDDVNLDISGKQYKNLQNCQ